MRTGKPAQVLHLKSINKTATPDPEQRSYYWQGFWAGAPFLLVVAPFGLLFGVVATEAGLDLVQTMSMTVMVIAGASQFAAVHLLDKGATEFVARLTAAAVALLIGALLRSALGAIFAGMAILYLVQYMLA